MYNVDIICSAEILLIAAVEARGIRSAPRMRPSNTESRPIHIHALVLHIENHVCDCTTAAVADVRVCVCLFASLNVILCMRGNSHINAVRWA